MKDEVARNSGLKIKAADYEDTPVSIKLVPCTSTYVNLFFQLPPPPPPLQPPLQLDVVQES